MFWDHNDNAALMKFTTVIHGKYPYKKGKCSVEHNKITLYEMRQQSKFVFEEI